MSSGKPKLRVAFDARPIVLAQPTGIGLMTLALLRELRQRDRIEITAVAHKEPACADELRRLGIEVLTDAAPLGVLWQQLRLGRRLKASGFDVLWSPVFTLPIFCPIPGVVHVHDLTAAMLPGAHTLKHRLSLLPFLRRSLRQARRIIVISEATRADLLLYEPSCSDRVTVVYNGVDDCFQPAESAAIQKTRNAVDCPDGYFLCSGTLEPRKNLARVLAAYELLLDQDCQPPPLLLTGASGWKQSELAPVLERLRSRGVRHLGYLERGRLVQIMQAATIFLYPSLYEGFGLPAAEAMACGVPVIASNTSSLPEVVGDCGLLIDPEDVQALAGGMRALLGDGTRRAALAKAGIARSRRFDWGVAAEALEEALFAAAKV